MKNTIIIVLTIFLVTIFSYTSHAECDPAPVEKVISLAKQAQDKALERAEKLLDTDVIDWLDKCFGGLTGGFSFGINLPSLSDLLDMVCNYANDKINEKISDIQAQFKLNPVPGFSEYGVEGGLSGGRGSGGAWDLSPTDATITDNSKKIADELFEGMKKEINDYIP